MKSPQDREISKIEIKILNILDLFPPWKIKPVFFMMLDECKYNSEAVFSKLLMSQMVILQLVMGGGRVNGHTNLRNLP